MSIFKRRKPQDQAAPSAENTLESTVDGAMDGAVDGASGGDPVTSSASASRGVDHGPWDIAEVKDLGERFDLGALIIPAPQGMELRLEIEETTHTVTGLTLAEEGSTMQLQAFAAPKTEGAWEGIRTEIAENLEGAGATVEHAEGTFGPELRTRMPMPAPDGRTVFGPVRFLGVDGPRWFLRAVLAGRAAVEDEVRAVFEGILGEVVVRRGDQPMAPREVLLLDLPAALTQPVDPEAEAPAPGTTDLNPFERGPEITEIR